MTVSSTSPVPVSRLSDIADRYDVLLCDVWGVIHNGRESFPEACAALATFVHFASSLISICVIVFDVTPISSTRLVDDNGESMTGA